LSVNVCTLRRQADSIFGPGRVPRAPGFAFLGHPTCVLLAYRGKAIIPDPAMLSPFRRCAGEKGIDNPTAVPYENIYTSSMS
jgi:hypothetical protein